MATFAKGGGKKGKDKMTANGQGPARGQGHKLPRTRVSAEKFTGVVAAWMGKYGWLTPDEPIEHEKAQKHQGGIFASMDDIEGGSSLDAGAPVEFHIWEDDDGLGAEEVVQTGAGVPGKGKGKKGQGKESSKGTVTKPSPFGAAAAGWGAAAGKGWQSGKAAAGWGAAAAAWAPATQYWKGGKGAKGVMSPFEKPAIASAAGFKGGKGKADGGKGKGQGHKLPRTRLSAEKFTGTVKAWKGKYGWITPSEEIEHEKASSHNGQLFVSLDDLEGGIKELTVGSTVEFHITEDTSGLGAEEVVQY